MFTKILSLITVYCFLLSGCTDGAGYFKKSANNKLFDFSGAKATKRPPLYNKKYVDQAKKNIADNNLDDENEIDIEDDSELIDPNPVKLNQEMYKDMLRNDLKNQQKKNKLRSANRPDINDNYPTLAEVNARMSIKQVNKNDLQQEIVEVKQMLSEARKELSKYKCNAAEGNSKNAALISNAKDLPKANLQNQNKSSSLSSNANLKLKSKFMPDSVNEMPEYIDVPEASQLTALEIPDSPLTVSETTEALQLTKLELSETTKSPASKTLQLTKLNNFKAEPSAEITQENTLEPIVEQLNSNKIVKFEPKTSAQEIEEPAVKAYSPVLQST